MGFAKTKPHAGGGFILTKTNGLVQAGVWFYRTQESSLEHKDNIFNIENLLYISDDIHATEHLGTMVAPQICNVREYEIYIKLVVYAVEA
jgi:hypothetical protein